MNKINKSGQKQIINIDFNNNNEAFYFINSGKYGKPTEVDEGIYWVEIDNQNIPKSIKYFKSIFDGRIFEFTIINYSLFNNSLL